MSRICLYTLLLVICSVACVCYAQNPIILSQQAAPKVLGTWTMSSRSYIEFHRTSKTKSTEKVVSVKCNTCPEITFTTDGTGCIKTESGEELISKFNWRMSGAMLIFMNHKSVSQETTSLANGSYRIMRSAGIKGIQAIDLIDSKGTRYTLVKSD